MTAGTAVTKKVWTEADLEALPEDGYIHEIVDGDLVMSPKNNWQHGDICTQLLIAIGQHAKQQNLGAVWDSSTGFWMRNRNCRAPDIAFVSKARLKGRKRSERQFFPGAPDLAVEVLAPSNTRAEIDSRLKDFFASGTQIAWIIDPQKQCAEVCHSLTDRKLIGSGAFLEGEHLLPGFCFPIVELFKEWEW
jgi:Uma2 family endonuclease